MAKPTVEIIGKKIILLSGYQRCPQIGSERAKLGSIVIKEIKKLRQSEQTPRRSGVRLHGWKMDACCLISFLFSSLLLAWNLS